MQEAKRRVLNFRDERCYTLISSILAIILALMVSAVFIFAMGLNPWLALKSLAEGAFGSAYSIGETAVKTAPLICTGLSFAMARRCGLLNIGAEGQLLIGGMCAGIVGIYVTGLPPVLHVALALMAAMLSGGLWGALAGLLKVRFGANEIITTIMLNYVALYLLNYMVAGPLQDPESSNTQSSKLLESAKFAPLSGSTRLHAGIIVAIVLAVLFSLFLSRTTRGYVIRVVGRNEHAAVYAGLRPGNNIMLAMFLAGALAGVGGAMEILGTQFRIYQSFSSNLGFDGIAVAVLGQNTAVGILLSAGLFGALKSGASLMKMNAGIPSSMANVLQGLVILFVISSRCVTLYIHKRRVNRQTFAKTSPEQEGQKC